MKCEDALPLINAWLDREIADGDRVALESHWNSCADCQAIADELRMADADLTRAFKSDRDAARNLADEVVSSLNSPTLQPAERVGTAPTRGTRPVDWRSLALAVVVGFLLALVIFPPSSHQQKPGPRGQIARPDNTDREPHERKTPAQNGFSRIATLVASTGDVQFDSGTGNWSDASPSLFHCASDSKVRTAKGARCELVTTDGAVIRMNGETEVTLRSAREVELQTGQLFCRAPDDVSIEVYSCKASASQSPPEQSAWSAAGSGSGFLTTLLPDGAGQVISSPSCAVSVTTKAGRHQLQPGESASIVNGQVSPTGRMDPLIAASWIHPLLTQKGHDNPELHQRVDELLARIGRDKMSMLYEREIRSLGEYCVLPLIRYVQSPISKNEPGRRGSAMAIVADLAPSITIGELLALLGDDSPEVRFQTARALLRLTGETLGRSPADWRQPLEECQDSIGAWSTWWQHNGDRFPKSVAGTKTGQ